MANEKYVIVSTTKIVDVAEIERRLAEIERRIDELDDMMGREKEVKTGGMVCLASDDDGA